MATTSRLERRAAGDPDQYRKQDLNHSDRRSSHVGRRSTCQIGIVKKQNVGSTKPVGWLPLLVTATKEKLTELIDELEGNLTDKEEK